MKAVVSVNSGSSSVKFGVYLLGGDQPLTLSVTGKIERIGVAPHLVVRKADGETLLEQSWASDCPMSHDDLLEYLFEWWAGHLDGNEPVAIGHRVVHGGTEFSVPCLVNGEILAKLDKLCSLAPLHQPHNLIAIHAIAKMAPSLLQVACFDTAFHHDKPEIASRIAIPRAMHDAGIRRYGFHGLSYEFVSRQLPELSPKLAGGCVVAAHLGNGASLCAIKAGKSVDSTMGFTALDGLMMGTRSGRIDPGVVLHLQTQMGMTAKEVETLLYTKSGLLGVSGISSDMQVLSASDDPAAAQAIELFAWRAARETAGLATSMGGLDGIVFTAGIGENHAGVRKLICDQLSWLGVRLDDEANAKNSPVISRADSAVEVRIIPTDEERMIAMHTLTQARKVLPL